MTLPDETVMYVAGPQRQPQLLIRRTKLPPCRTLPHPLRLLPKDDGGFDENSSLSLDEQRKAWAAEAHAAELQAKEEQAVGTANRFSCRFALSHPVRQVLDGLTLYTSNKTDSGYRCVHSQYLSRLGVFAYEVLAVSNSDICTDSDDRLAIGGFFRFVLIVTAELCTSADSSRSCKQQSPLLDTQRLRVLRPRKKPGTW